MRSTKLVILYLMKNVCEYNFGKELRNSPCQKASCTKIIPTGALIFRRHLVTATPWTWVLVVWTHTLHSRRQWWLIPAFSFIYFLYLSLYLQNPMMRESKMKYEIVLKDETPRSESTQLLGKSREQVQTALLLMTQQDQGCKDKQLTRTKATGK